MALSAIYTLCPIRPAISFPNRPTPMHLRATPPDAVEWRGGRHMDVSARMGIEKGGVRSSSFVVWWLERGGAVGPRAARDFAITGLVLGF